MKLNNVYIINWILHKKILNNQFYQKKNSKNHQKTPKN